MQSNFYLKCAIPKKKIHTQNFAKMKYIKKLIKIIFCHNILSFFFQKANFWGKIFEKFSSHLDFVFYTFN
jgi:hypothetical protein